MWNRVCSLQDRYPTAQVQTPHHVLKQPSPAQPFSVCHNFEALSGEWDKHFLSFFFFSGPHLWHMEVPRLGSN